MLDRKKLSKVDPTKGRHVPLETLGQALLYQGRLLDQQELFTKIGETQRQLGEYQIEYSQTLKSCFLVHMEALLELLKDYQQVKKKLKMRRLDYDAKLNKMQKSKKEKPEYEEEVQASQLKYESSLQAYEDIMCSIQEKHSQLTFHMSQMMKAQKNYHQQCLSTVSAAIDDLPQITEQLSLDDKRSSMTSLPMQSLNNSFSCRSDKSSEKASISLSSSMSSITLAKKEDDNSSVLKRVKAIFPFQATQEDELAMQQGELLDVLDMVDDGWWVAKNEKGNVGMIPSNYVEVFSNKSSIDKMEILPTTAPRKSSDGNIRNDPLGISNISKAMTRNSGNTKNASNAEKCKECSCDDFSPNVFKPGSCNNCFHKHL